MLDWGATMGVEKQSIHGAYIVVIIIEKALSQDGALEFSASNS